jgi:hypothetical protein
MNVEIDYVLVPPTTTIVDKTNQNYNNSSNNNNNSNTNHIIMSEQYEPKNILVTGGAGMFTIVLGGSFLLR